MYVTFYRFLIAGLLFISFTAHAQEQQAKSTLNFAAVPLYSGWAYSFSVGSVGFDPNAAKEEGIDDRAFSLGADAEYLWAGKPLSAVFGFSWISYSDNEKITVTTVGTGTNNEGDLSTSSSDASAIEVHAEYGLRHRFGPNKGGFFILRGGYLLNMFSERSISNCSNCPSSDIDINGGAYAVSGIGFNGGQTFSMGLNYKKFFTGDFDQALNLEFRWSSY